MAWSIANFVLQGQILGFKVDTWPHCLGPSSNYPMVAMSVLVAIFAHVCVAAGFLFTGKPLSLYQFPHGFRYKFYGVLLAAAGFFVVARGIRQLTRWLQQKRYQALLLASGGSRQLFSSRNSLGSAERRQALPSFIGVRELSTKLRWLSFRAPKIVPLTPEMSLAIAHGSSQSRTVNTYPPAKPSPKSSKRNTAERV